MIIFDYMYYKVCYVYKKYRLLDKEIELVSCNIVSFFITSNLYSILYISNVIEVKNHVYSFALYVILFIINTNFFFNEKKLVLLEEKWKDEKRVIKNIKSILIWIYCIGSFAFYILM